MANVECGRQVQGHFSERLQFHEYKIAAEPGQTLDIQVSPVGDYLRVRVVVAEPGGDGIADSQYQSKVQLQTGRLSAKGLYSVKVYNTELGPRIEDPGDRENMLTNGRYRESPLGNYVLSITCINSDGTWVAQGTFGTDASSPSTMGGPGQTQGAQDGTLGKYDRKAQEVQQVIGGVAGTVQALRELWGAIRSNKSGAAGGAQPGTAILEAPAYQGPEDVVPKGRQPVYARPVEAPAAQAQKPGEVGGELASSGRACQDNYAEAGEWSTGKSFKSYVELKGTALDEAFLAIGRAVAIEGFLGVTTNKDLGLVSAYQENSGKKSTITAVLSEETPGTVRAEIAFRLAPDLRAPSAAIRDSLCKVLEAAVPAEQRTAQNRQVSGIRLLTGSGEQSLESTVGTLRNISMGPVLLLFFDFSGARAAIRTDDRKPVLLVRANTDPAKSYSLVRCEPDEKDGLRSVKVGSAGKLLKMGLTGKGDLAPDKDWTLPFVAERESEGIWRVMPSGNLKPGEYGLWDIQGYGVALFGVD